MHKLCYEVCIKTKRCDHCACLSIVGMQYDDHVYHMHYILLNYEQYFSLHDASHIDIQQQCAWFLSLDNSQTETMPGVFLATNHFYVHGFILVWHAVCNKNP